MDGGSLVAAFAIRPRPVRQHAATDSIASGAVAVALSTIAAAVLTRKFVTTRDDFSAPRESGLGALRRQDLPSPVKFEDSG